MTVKYEQSLLFRLSSAQSQVKRVPLGGQPDVGIEILEYIYKDAEGVVMFVEYTALISGGWWVASASTAKKAVNKVKKVYQKEREYFSEKGFCNDS